jgi:hypothetical protein
MEPRARVELATCRLRIGCSTTELPRLCVDLLDDLHFYGFDATATCIKLAL